MLFFVCSTFCFDRDINVASKIVDCVVGQQDFPETSCACTAMALTAISHLMRASVEDITPVFLTSIITTGRNFYKTLDAFKVSGLVACDDELIDKFNENTIDFPLLKAGVGVDGSSAAQGRNCFFDELSALERSERYFLSTDRLINILWSYAHVQGYPVGALWTIGMSSYGIVVKDDVIFFYDSHRKSTDASTGSHVLIFVDPDSCIRFMTSCIEKGQFAVTFASTHSVDAEAVQRAYESALAKTSKNRIFKMSFLKNVLMVGTVGVMFYLVMKKALKKAEKPQGNRFAKYFKRS